METIMSIKDLHKNLKNIPEIVNTKGNVLVVKNSKPAFKIVSIKTKRKKTYSLDDLKKMQFTSEDKNLSGNLDNYLY